MSFGVVAASYLAVIDHPGSGSAYADLVLTHSPLLYWRLGEASGATAVDTSGNGRDGAYSNSPNTPQLGSRQLLVDDDSSSVFFDGARAVLSAATWMNVAEMTITCVYLCGAETTGLQMLASRYYDDDADVSWYLYRENHEFKFHYRGSGGQGITVSSGVTEQLGQTYYIAAWCGAAGAGIRVYCLGALLGSATGTGYALNGSSRPFVVAGCDSGIAYRLTGYVQEVAYFGSMLGIADLDVLASLATAPQPKWLTRTAGVSVRNGTSSHTFAFPAASSGSLLVAVVSGSVTSTATTPGWTKQLNPADYCEVAVFTYTAGGGETSLQVSCNGSNYPLNYVIYEFPAGTTWVSGVGQSNGSAPDLTGLPGTPVTVFAVVSMASTSAGDPLDVGATWAWRWVEDVDVMTIFSGTDGVYTAIGWRSYVTSTSISPGSDGYFGSVYAITNNFNTRTSATFAIVLP